MGSTTRKLNEENFLVKLKNFRRQLIEYYTVLAVVQPIVTESRCVQLKVPFAFRVERRAHYANYMQIATANQ